MKGATGYRVLGKGFRVEPTICFYECGLKTYIIRSSVCGAVAKGWPCQTKESEAQLKSGFRAASVCNFIALLLLSGLHRFYLFYVGEMSWALRFRVR